VPIPEWVIAYNYYEGDPNNPEKVSSIGGGRKYTSIPILVLGFIYRIA